MNLPDLRRSRDELVGVRETRNVPFTDVELREKSDGAGGVTLEFEGYACTTEQPYEMADWLGPYTEVVRRGSFGKTLSEGADVGFLVNHEGMHLARTKSGTLQLAEDDTGLNVLANFDPGNPQVVALRSALERGDVDEMSFAFRVTRQTWSPDYDQRDILEVNIDKGDVSAVNYGANPFTSGGLRSLRSLRSRGAGATMLRGLAELRAGKALSTATMDTLTEVLGLISTADDSVDEALETLSDLMGVSNPDKPEPDAEDIGEAKGFPLSLALAQARLLDLHK